MGILLLVLILPSSAWLESLHPLAGIPVDRMAPASLPHESSPKSGRLTSSITGPLAPPTPRHFQPSPDLPVTHAALYATSSYHPSARNGPRTAPAPIFVDPVQAPSTSPLVLNRGTGFEGLNSSQCTCVPPDVQTASSPTQVAELVNVAIGVWTTTGRLLGGESLVNLFNLTGAPSPNVSDPKVLFDPDSGRWFVSALTHTSSAGFYITLAVSKTSDATGWWWLYTSIHASGGDLPDQPILGVSHDLLGLASNDFTGSGFAGSQFWIINKSAAINGSSPAFASFGPYPTSFSIHPARSVQTSDGLYMAELYPGNPGFVEIFQATHVPPATVSVATTNLSVAPLSDAPRAPQPGTTSLLDDGRSMNAMDALWSGDQLWVVTTDACTVASLNLSCLRLVEVSTIVSMTITQDFDVAVRSAYILYAAISLDIAGNLVLDFGVSSGTIYPSLLATFQGASDPVDTMHPAIPMHNGSSTFTGCSTTPCRYGDYFGSSIQPGSAWVWTAGEFVDSTHAWTSWLQAVRAQGPMGEFTSASPGTVDLGQSTNVLVHVLNSTCPPGGPQRCSLALPFGDTATNWTNCTYLAGVLAVPHTYATAGAFPAGRGGSITVYSTSTCRSGGGLPIPLSSTSVQVMPTPAVSVAISPSSAADAGEYLQFTAAPSGGVSPYAYVWSGLPAGCTGNDSPALACAPSSVGSYDVAVQITDQLGVSAVGHQLLAVSVAPAVKLTATAAHVDAGQTVTWQGLAGGGSGVFTYVWAGLPSPCAAANTSAVTCAPAAKGTYRVTLSVVDSRGVSGSGIPAVLTVADRLSAVIQGPAGPVPSGTAVDLQANVSGGTNPVTYQWSSLPTGCGRADNATVTCQAPPGHYLITVTARDATGASVNASFDLVVAPTGPSTYGGLSVTDLLVIAGVVIVVVALAVALLFRRRRPPPPTADPDIRWVVP